jgi:hypothetical protein
VASAGKNIGFGIKREDFREEGSGLKPLGVVFLFNPSINAGVNASATIEILRKQKSE